ncbi:hypothetical protein ACD591_01120 [Rufibacter glacialis]|uniref:Uncharacterized protein n=1 Tax=Rufibacter glacialis TaxID=1259555 RepID=A0A5M8QK19_9BACT|nr:hypothetical protein [Rufibacter glacialis]KAA6435501.1 hypothetical protein FOE74_06025 [Rufibacter glacialis]GGK64069.1 hypothetical protein GCM10011405_10050 [Rufibacter glacialis]
MREIVIDKIQYFYKDRIDYIESCLKELLYIEFNIGMIGVSKTLNKPDENGVIFLNKSIGYNSRLIILEIFEDLNCSLDLLKSAYFKQSKQILRNTLELTTQLLYTESLIKESLELSPWTNGKRGTDKLFQMTAFLRKKVAHEIKPKIKEIEKFYNLLNQSTHSHKAQLNSKQLGKFDGIGVFGFEHTEFQNAFVILLCCINITIHLIKHFYEKLPKEPLKDELINKLISIDQKLEIFSSEVKNYKKGDYENGEGYLIYKKHMQIKGTSILYSYLANYRIHWPSKVKGKQVDHKLISDAIDNEMIKKKIPKYNNS